MLSIMALAVVGRILVLVSFGIVVMGRKWIHQGARLDPTSLSIDIIQCLVLSAVNRQASLLPHTLLPDRSSVLNG